MLNSRWGISLYAKVYIFGQVDWVSCDIQLVRKKKFVRDQELFVVKSGQLLAQVIARIAPHAPQLYIVAIEPDNHGRLNPKFGSFDDDSSTS